MNHSKSNSHPEKKSAKRETQDVKRIQQRIARNHTDDVNIERATKRKLESQSYQSVIVKRTDETFRHADDILELAIHEGREQMERPGWSLGMSSVAGGMIIGFTVLAVAVMASILGSLDGLNKIAVALVYPLGFVLCILSRTQLFTEHTATAVYPLLDGSVSITKVLKLWVIVIAGNLIGGFIISALLTAAEPVIGASEGYQIIADHVLHFSALELFFSAILAGWLMAIGAWTILSTHSTTSQILCIYVATFVIGVGGLHHSIAGSVELFVGAMTSASIDFVSIIPAILVILAGNAVGGAVFVALVNHGHIRGLR